MRSNFLFTGNNALYYVLTYIHVLLNFILLLSLLMMMKILMVRYSSWFAFIIIILQFICFSTYSITFLLDFDGEDIPVNAANGNDIHLV